MQIYLTGWSCLVGGILSSFVICCTGGHTLARSGRVEEMDESSGRHKFRPVSILHQFPQQNSVQMHNLQTCIHATPCEKHLTFHRKNVQDPSPKRRTKTYTSAPSSEHSSGEKKRKQGQSNTSKKSGTREAKQQRTTTSGPVQSKKTFV